MTHLSATELAGRLNVSKPRISQYVAEGKLDGCFIGDGRARRFDLERVKTALNRTLDPGQMLGNGAETKRALRDAAPSQKPAAPKTDRELARNDPDRYELARTQVAEEDARRRRRDNERDEGRWVLAEDVQRHTARILAQEIAQIESFLRDASRALADTLGVDARAARKILMDQWRAHRALRSGAASDMAEAAIMTDAELEADA